VFSHQFINTEHENAVLDNAPQPVFDFLDEQDGDAFPESFVSRRQLKLRSVNSDSSNLKLAAFNVQTFGTKKMATKGVPDILVKIILRYDVILIQEIRDSSGKAIMELLALVNKTSTRGQYGIAISPRLGRTSRKEQYAFLYRTDVLSVKRSYVYDDGQERLGNDTFEREPYIVQFNSTLTNITDFVLVAIHTSPSKAPQEIDELASVYDDVIKKLNIGDVIILGDLNAACSYMSDNDWRKNRLANDKRFHWLISECVDTSLAGGHCAYDRFVAAGDAMLKAVIESSAGSFEYDQAFGVNKTMASQVSDHYPIEIQVYSQKMATAMSKIKKAVEYTFKMKQPTRLSKWKIYGLRKKFNASGFTVITSYRKSGGISVVTFNKNFRKRKEAVNTILYIKDKAQPVNVISLDQIQMAEFQIKGAWSEDKNLLTANCSGVVKLVCEIYPSPNCWIAIQLQT